VLTPEYAAPEQVLGQPITTATDVYALGLLLHEMLTGERAQRLAGLSALEAARAVIERDPPRPSDAAGPHGRALRGDLDAIVGMALRKEPGRRYAGAQALGDDLRRYLSGHAVAARADTWSYRAGKFARRHRLGIAASAAIVLALLAGLASSMWQAQQARLQAQRAETVKEFVTDLFRTVDPRTGKRGGRDMPVHALIEGGAEQLRTRLGAQPADRARAPARTERSVRGVGRLRRRVGAFRARRSRSTAGCTATAMSACCRRSRAWCSGWGTPVSRRRWR
jgi:serine/threonine-protein kinase